MKLHELVEARKNPEANPKISINQAVAQAKDQPNTYISFTEVDKLGINPKSVHETPIGIYAYPIKYVAQMMGDQKSGDILPYAGDAPFANIFQARGNIIDLATLSVATIKQYYREMETYVETIDPDLEGAVDDARETAFEEGAVRTQAGWFWYTTMVIAQRIEDVTGTRSVIAWNKLFRHLGIDGFVDSRGKGIIHENEPVQAVFFSIKSIANNLRVYNRYSPEHMGYSKERGSRMQRAIDELKNATTVREVEAVIQVHGPDTIKLVRDRAIRLQLIIRDPQLIRWIVRPTKEEQREALEQLFEMMLIIINNLDQDIVAEVFSEAPTDNRANEILYTFQSKHRLSPKLQMAIVRYNKQLILDINHPAKHVVEWVVRNYGGPPKSWLNQLKKEHNIE